jgi:hypothetical protein
MAARLAAGFKFFRLTSKAWTRVGGGGERRCQARCPAHGPAGQHRLCLGTTADFPPSVPAEGHQVTPWPPAACGGTAKHRQVTPHPPSSLGYPLPSERAKNNAWGARGRAQNIFSLSAGSSVTFPQRAQPRFGIHPHRRRIPRAALSAFRTPGSSGENGDV